MVFSHFIYNFGYFIGANIRILLDTLSLSYFESTLLLYILPLLVNLLAAIFLCSSFNYDTPAKYLMLKQNA